MSFERLTAASIEDRDFIDALREYLGKAPLYKDLLGRRAMQERRERSDTRYMHTYPEPWARPMDGRTPRC